MKENNEQLSALIDNEIVDHDVIDERLLAELIADEQQQSLFSRYQLIGDVMRGDLVDQAVNIDISEQVMADINQELSVKVLPFASCANKPAKSNSINVIPFFKRFGQYAIAASVAGVVVLTSLVTSQSVTENNSGIEVLNTVPFGGAVAPVSLQATPLQSKQAIKAHNERLEALLKDHQLQLQTQP